MAKEAVVETPVTKEGGDASKVVVEETREEVRYKNDLLKFKQDAKVLKEENETLKEQKKNDEINKLKEKDEWQTVATQWEERALQSEQKEKNNFKAYLEDKKRAAVEQEALKLKIKPNFMHFLHAEAQDGVEVETTSAGNVIINGAKNFVEDFKNKYSAAFDENKIPFINTANPQVGNEKTYSASDLLKLEKEDKGKYRELMTKVVKGEIKLKN